MKKRILIILLISTCAPHFAFALNEEECIKLGGTFTDLGCLFPSKEQEEFVKRPDLYLPDKEHCERLDGIWHEEYGCIAKLTDEECKQFGGILDSELGCKKNITKEQCEKIGGTFKENGQCDTTNIK